MDSNLLKEAIADAKAVRQTALANAKVALEEAFNERYHAMFAEKLKEDAGMGKDLPPAPDEEHDRAGGTVAEQEIDELIKELEAEVGESPGAEPDMSSPTGGSDVPDAMADSTATPPVDGPVPVPPGYKPAPGAVVPISSEQPGGEVPPTPPVPPSPTDSAVPPSDTPPGPDETDEEINLDELLESLKDEIDGENDDKKLDEDKKLSSSAIAPGGNKKPSASASSSSGIESGGCKDHGIPDGHVVAKDPTEVTKQEKNFDGNKDGNLAETPTIKENQDLKRQLNEAEDVIKYVKSQLNDVNLLNAKLLYTNKLFKEYNMSNDHKMRVVEMFDIAKNVREVKLTYTNIAESLNFGGSEHKKKPIKESVSVRTITEGLASKPVGSTKPSKEIISESKTSAMVAKFQKLAGIKKS